MEFSRDHGFYIRQRELSSIGCINCVAGVGCRLSTFSFEPGLASSASVVAALRSSYAVGKTQHLAVAG